MGVGKFVFILFDFVWFGGICGWFDNKVVGTKGVGKLGSPTRYICMDFSRAAHVSEAGGRVRAKEKGEGEEEICVGSCLSDH